MIKYGLWCVCFSYHHCSCVCFPFQLAFISYVLISIIFWISLTFRWIFLVTPSHLLFPTQVYVSYTVLFFPYLFSSLLSPQIHNTSYHSSFLISALRILSKMIKQLICCLCKYIHLLFITYRKISFWTSTVDRQEEYVIAK